MVASLLKVPPAVKGAYHPSQGYLTPISPTLLNANDQRGQISDYAILVERSERRLRFTRPGTEDYQAATPGARYRMQTDATVIKFNFATNNLVRRHDARNYQFTVLVNSVATASFDSRSATYSLNLGSASNRLVELIWPYGDGVDLLSVQVNTGANFYEIPHRPTRKIICAGDSITQGFSATKTTDSWPFKLSESKGLQLINLGDGGDMAIATYAEGLNGLAADYVTYMIGYNDFYNQTEMDDFQDAVEGWITNAIAALPSSKIYIISPVYSINTNAITLDQYRTAMAAAVLSVGAVNVTYVNGLSIMTNSSTLLTDGIHPSNAGNAEIATSLASLITL